MIKSFTSGAPAKLALFLLASASPMASAWAQDAKPPVQETEEATGIQDIVVTAQRREERLQDVPIAVSTIEPSQIETAGVLNALDLPRIAPGVTTSPTAANSFFIPYIRGVGSNSPATGNDSSIAVYIDGVYQSDKSANILEFNSIERMEVLKGPQGTLFGRNATGGAINIVTRQPQFEFSGSAEASYGRFDQWVAKGYVTGPISDSIAFNASYMHTGGGDFATNTGTRYPGKFGGGTGDSVDAKLLIKPGDNLEITLGAMYMDRTTTNLNSNLNPVRGTMPVGTFFGGTFDPDIYEYQGSPNTFGVEAFRATGKIRYSFPGVDLVSITGYVETTVISQLDYDGTSADFYYFDEIQGVEDFSQEVQLLSTGSGPVQWVLGAYYFDGTAQIEPLNIIQNAPYTHSFSQIAATPGATATHVNAEGRTRAIAGYGQLTWAVTPTTKITAGLRYTSETRGYDFNVQGIGQIAPLFYSATLVPLVSDSGLEATFDKLTWRLAVDQELAPDVMGYVSYNRGFKSGTFNMNDFTPGQVPVRPEQLDAYEVGVKSQFANRTVQLNLAAFYYDYKDIQLDIIVAGGGGGGTTSLQNAASETIYGLDLDMIVQPTRDLRFRASGTLMHAEYDSFPNAVAFVPDPVTGNGNQTVLNASGTEGLFAPSWSFNLGVDYTARLPGDGKLIFSASYFRTDGFKVGVGPQDRVFEYDSLGASLTYEPGGMPVYVRVFGANLTDQRVIGVNMSALKQSRQEIVPLTYGVAVGFRF
ncbi:TonB-dependent receptor [Sphingomonas sp. AOB5]|uniref:TonB-dependent receptor n=1 Tax=Sphingomonas sp. AOB5 TaxID=3034017 RepID=UPI0023F9037F|nr:TonB-dependent receptor [Sphingomonas sp. AOB5]MDF7774759.1 TonB-dependent receptor [Sphingomonas sp. AOB5]